MYKCLDCWCSTSNTWVKGHMWQCLNMSVLIYRYAHRWNHISQQYKHDKSLPLCFPSLLHTDTHTHINTHSCRQNPFHITIPLPIIFWIHRWERNMQWQPCTVNTIGHACLWILRYKNSGNSGVHAGFVSYAYHNTVCSPSVT